MPTKALKACQYPGCPRLSGKRYCEEHRQQVVSEGNRAYNSNNRDMELQKFYQSIAWRKLRAVKLASSPMCELCHAEGRGTKATIVDHIVSIKDSPDGKLMRDNLQSVCKSCHTRKTKAEERARRQGDFTPPELPKEKERRYFS